jgi:hypothetical protein
MGPALLLLVVKTARLLVAVVSTAVGFTAGTTKMYQKISTVAKYQLVKVVAPVTLDGTVGHGDTHYTPPSLAAYT